MGELRGRLLLRLHRRGPGQDSVVEVIESFSVLARLDGVVGSPSEECMYTVTPLKCATSVSLGVKRAFVSVVTPLSTCSFSPPLGWTIGTHCGLTLSCETEIDGGTQVNKPLG